LLGIFKTPKTPKKIRLPKRKISNLQEEKIEKNNLNFFIKIRVKFPHELSEFDDGISQAER